MIDESKALLNGELGFTLFSDSADDAERIIDLQAHPRQIDPEAVQAERADVQKVRKRLTETGNAVIEAIAQYSSRWLRTAVEDTVVADPERNLNAAAQQPDLKISLLQL
ncbi:MAG: hypothetical protein N2037_05330 [Acidimicrobiales bacterium]|nr:hypothetical protein [Acidimicrobiales bacterium]